ncbi:hypothetical protein SeMB42_g02177 [Synchytrium endobioticum]|uniref:Uncharacterized protein n=1 Tax=Synchytrium endobioticum TaxID=286115 RepID=A0A507DGI2_9FUNG|nr:hypothetical protein SeLEV6574_g02836 [Synchytrium endobioticum]TPX50656.1 hypothetical protein SeMB42_g02177 [Synchytrium endobioticum]
MGACCSWLWSARARSANDEERRALLASIHYDNGDTSTQGQTDPQTSQPRAFKQRELDALRQIVKRTADGLIDASSLRPLDGIHHSDNPFAQLSNLLKQDEASSFPQSPLPSSLLPLSKVTDILGKPGPSTEDVQGMQSALLLVSQSLEAFKIENVGELVVALTIPQQVM